jgi:3-oxoacyl-[acyl-carrier protein] reductase
MMDIQGKVVLITGGGTGLGRVIARHLAQAGMHVAVGYSRSERDAFETVTMLQDLGVKALAVQADLNAPSAVTESKRMVEDVAEHFGRLDLLINNAGITRAVPFHQIEALTEADWDTVLNVHTKAPFFTTQAAVPIMRQNGGGHVINTASVSGIRASGGSNIAYSVSKAGTIHLTKCLATALGPDIRVNAVAPGCMETRWNDIFNGEKAAYIQAATQQSPLKQVTRLEDAAAAYVMLARNESITGQIITVDSGLTL